LFIIYELGLSISFVGYALFFYGVTHIFQFWFGKISDKYGSWKIVLLGCLIFAIGLGFLSISDNFLLIVLFLFIQGAGGGMWNTSAWSLMSDIGEKYKKEGSVVTTYISLAKMGAFVSFLLSGLVVTFYGIQTLFLINSFVILAGIALAYGFLKNNI
jgi:MFS family permease